ncbi:hypothetical protein B4Q04_18015 [Zobellia sp. OII3]|uniref:prolyl oligopeptidase family serine peptidase n=1 Tax=Zobellia sp. OII3 TaxID=2034520 RepID=UPI000B536C31|nr:prolyl oligopeptidase family serine peptidase [Zobellia sp. OII3]OWW24007.1 hypothetical protein B4Q04_18015 [Zobellia sp. OII3]
MKSSKIFKLLIITLASGLFLSCSSDSSDNTPQPKEITFEDVDKSFSELQIEEGNNDFRLEVPNGLFWNFRVTAPKPSEEKKPLFINLHGAAGGSPDAHKNTSCYLENATSSINAFVVSPNGGTYQWFEPINQSQVMGIVTLALKYWNIDSNKVVVTGYSNGGIGSWFFAETQPEVFSAGIPLASSYNTTNTNGEARKIDSPLYVIHGEDDELFPLSQTQTWVEQSVEVGSEIEFVVANGLTHNELCQYAPYFDDAVLWLTTSIWK